MIRTVIVDDEPPARRKLQRLLAGESEFTVVAEAASGQEAIDVIRRSKPDLVFLDISLPDRSAFEVLQEAEPCEHLHIVFVTAHQEYAVQGFDVNAVDYLLKPVEPSRFARALQRIKKAVLSTEPPYPPRLLVQERGHAVLLDVEHIDWLEAAGNYVCVHASGQTYVVRSTLDSLLRKLNPARFRRINRSEAINLSRIVQIHSVSHGDQKVRLHDGRDLTWSRRYRMEETQSLERA